MDMKKNLALVLLLTIPLFVVVGLQSGMFQIEDTGVFTVIYVSSTDNTNVQLIEKGTRFLSGQYVNYYSLPMKISQFGNSFSATYFFSERHNVNGTWQTLEHGPFSIRLYRGSSHIQLVELNYNNVTIKGL